MSKQIDNIKANLVKAQRALEDQIEKHLRLFLEKVKTDAVNEIDRAKKTATGQTRNNIRSEVTRMIGKIVGVVGVAGSVKHAIFAHEDTKPHFPPVEDIQRWVILKGLVKLKKKPTNMRRLYGNLFSGGRAGKEASSVLKESQQIAFLIARKIAAKGTKGLPFLRTALNLNRGFLMTEMSKIKI